MVGIETVRIDDPLLTVRAVKGRNPLRIVLDSRLRIPLNAQVLQGEAKTLVVTTYAHNKKKVQNIQQQGKEVLVIKRDTKGQVDLWSLMQVLAERGISSILVEGGGAIITSFLKGRLVNRVVVITAPLILGRGIEGIGDLGIGELKHAIRPSTYKMSRTGEDVIFDLRL
jgi:riboflavin-specific deaminase-like protein